jgi:energy-coupling factor transport system ATP-binding protein
MLRVERLSYRYPASRHWAMHDIDVTFHEGESVALLGESGSGKTSLLRALNGLIPHFYGGALAGRVLANGLDTRQVTTADLSAIVGYLHQEPESQSILDRVHQEIAFGPANQGLTRAEVLERVDEALSALDIEHLCDREMSTLSGGERQRVEIAATLASRPSYLALDEPFSQIDPWSAHRIAAWLGRVVADGLGLIIAEHRVARTLPISQSLIHIDSTGTVGVSGGTRACVGHLPYPPPLVRVARALDWPVDPLTPGEAAAYLAARRAFAATTDSAKPRHHTTTDSAIELRDLTYAYRDRTVVESLTLSIPAGRTSAVMGENGSGKSTLLKVIAGLTSPSGGEVRIFDQPVSSLSPARRARVVGYVPQAPSHLFLADTVRDEVVISIQARGEEVDPEQVLQDFDLRDLRDRYPFDLSGGERQRLALAIALAGDPPVAILDEPTRGMDHRHLGDLIRLLAEREACGHTTVIATHDAELAAALRAHVVLIKCGTVTRTGDVADVFASVDALRTDIQRVFGDGYLLAEDVVSTLAPAGRRAVGAVVDN